MTQDDREALVAQARALQARAEVARENKDYPLALQLLTELLALTRMMRNRRWECDVLGNLGHTYLAKGDLAQAMDHFQQSQKVAQSNANTGGEVRAIGMQGKVLATLGRRDQAIAKLREAAQLCERVPVAWERVSVLMDMGYMVQQLGEHTLSVQLWTQLLEVVRSMKDHTQECDTLGRLGHTYLAMGDLAQALDYFQQSQKVAHSIADGRREANAASQQGHVLARLGQRDRAVARIREAVQLSVGIPDGRERASFLGDLGYAVNRLGERTLALEAIDQAERLFREAGDLKWAATMLDHRSMVLWSDNQYQKALAARFAALELYDQVKGGDGVMSGLAAIARMYWSMGDVPKAIHYFERMLTVAKDQDHAGYQGEALRGIAEFYDVLGRPETALTYSVQATDIYRRLARRGELGWALREQANLLAQLKRYDDALARLQEARRINAGVQDPIIGAELAEFAGYVYQMMGRRSEALPFYRRALAQIRAAEAFGDEAAMIRDIIGRDIFPPREARGYLERALELTQGYTDRLSRVQTLAALGNVEAQLGQPREAERRYRDAMALAERIRHDAGDGLSTQGALFEQLGPAYVGCLTLLVDQGRAAEAFQIAQKIKARELLDILAGGHIDLDDALTPDERSQVRRRRAACEALSALMVGEAAQNVPGSKKRFETLQAQLIEAEQDLALYQDALYARHPRLGQRRMARLVTPAELARALPADAALLEFAPMTGGRTALLVATRGSVSAHAIPTKALETSVPALRAGCSAPGKAWRPAAEALYRTVLLPVEARLRGKRQLIVCPDRALWEAPFAALTDRDGTPLLERFVLSYANSATAWHVAQATARKRSATPKLLVLANPRFDAEARFGSGATAVAQRPITVPDRPITVPDRPITVPDRPITVPDRDLRIPRATRLVDLPGTQREADALKRQFPDATVLTRSAAQESAVKGRARQFQRLHIASHAFVNDASPLLSSVVLANPDPASGEDGLLTARELVDLDLSGVELTVLSACNTARGATKGGEGVVGLTWALFAAGCPTQVLSQWAVDDAGAAVLMGGFYRAMGQGQGKARALQTAALSLRRSARHRHPYYWASFVLIGDPR